MPFRENSRLAVSHPSPFCLDTSQSLDEMNRDIVHYVLNACKGNQTAAAKKAGYQQDYLVAVSEPVKLHHYRASFLFYLCYNKNQMKRQE